MPNSCGRGIGSCLKGVAWNSSSGPARRIEVDEVFGRPLVPRWLGNGVPMTAELARRIYLFRVQAAESLRDGDAALHAWLKSDFHLNDDAADLILRLIQEQETVSEVPPADASLIECVPMQSCVEYFVHTPLPRSANGALVLRVAWAIGASRQRGRRQSRFLLDRACGRSDAADDLADRLACRRFRGGFADRLADGELMRHYCANVAQTGLMLLRDPGQAQTQGRRQGLDPTAAFRTNPRWRPRFSVLRQAGARSSIARAMWRRPSRLSSN